MTGHARFGILLCLSLLISACSSPPAANGDTASGYDLRVNGDKVALSLTRDLTVPEFLQLAQQVTQARYVYDSRSVANLGPVTLVGGIRCRKAEFPAFVATMLHTRGLVAEVRGSGDTQYIEVGPIAKG